MTSDLPSDTASRIKRLRTRHHLTQSRLAELMGVTPGLVSQWETGRARPSPEKWLQLERGEALGLYALSPDFGQRGAAGQAGTVREEGAAYTVQPNDITFSADPEVVRLMLQEHRLAYGHLANPTWATETARIEPPPSAASDGDPAHGQGVPLLPALAAVGA